VTGLGVKPERIVFIDDQAHNIEEARRYGIKGINFSGQRDSVNALKVDLERFGIVVSE